MQILSMRMRWLIVICSRAVWVLSRTPGSAMISDISKRVAVRLLTSSSTTSPHWSSLCACEQGVFDVAIFVHGARVAFVRGGDAHLV